MQRTNTSLLRGLYHTLCPRPIRRLLTRLRYSEPGAFAEALGIGHGLSLYLRLHIGSGERDVRVPGIRTPLMVRRKTSDVAVFRKIFVDREYEFPVGWHPNTIVDAGANCGYSTVYFASRFPKSRILAIEPDEANLAVLRHNTSGYPNVTILSAALWPTSERLAIVDKSAEKWAIQVQPANEQAERTIAAITMEDVLAWAGRDRLGIVKIDIEGAEKRLFEGPGAWLGRVDCIAVELHDWFVGGCTAALENAISPYCFARSTRGENTILVATTSDPAGNAFAGGHMTDEGPRATSGK